MPMPCNGEEERTAEVFNILSFPMKEYYMYFYYTTHTFSSLQSKSGSRLLKFCSAKTFIFSLLLYFYPLLLLFFPFSHFLLPLFSFPQLYHFKREIVYIAV